MITMEEMVNERISYLRKRIDMYKADYMHEHIESAEFLLHELEWLIEKHKAGLSFVGCEIDKDYFDAQEKRFKEFVSQLRLF